MCLRFVFLLAVRLPAWLRLSRRSTAWKDAEILLLRHQITLLERRSTARQKPTWADRALFAALLAVIPRTRHAGLHLPVTPATILRWHRDLVKRRWAAKSRPNKPGRPRRHPTTTRAGMVPRGRWATSVRGRGKLPSGGREASHLRT